MKKKPVRRHAMNIADIKVGKRHRKDHGDIASLAASMDALGLLHPVVVTLDGKLIAGARRLKAAKQLRWTEIPVRVVDLDNIVRGEFSENTERKDFTLTEAVAIKRVLEPLEKKAAKARQQQSKGRGKKGGQVAPSFIGRAADKAAKATGKKRRTLEKAEAIVVAAEAEPKKYGKFAADMDRTGRVDGVYRRLKVAQQAERIRAEPPPLPRRGPYRCVVVDFPWPDNSGRDDPSYARIVPDFPPMTIKEICAFPLASMLMPDAVVWLWVTNYELLRGIHLPVLEAHGLQAKALLTWGKPHIGSGNTLRGQTEHAIMTVRGKAALDILTNQSTWLLAKRPRGHSSKPPEFYDMVELLCPAPRYADVFSRYRHNNKWEAHGDEAPVMQEAAE